MDRTTGFAVTVAVFVTVVTGGMQVEDPPGVQVDDSGVQGEINPDSYLAERNESIQASDLWVSIIYSNFFKYHELSFINNCRAGPPHHMIRYQCNKLNCNFCFEIFVLNQ